jgi:hypothetical protein
MLTQRREGAKGAKRVWVFAGYDNMRTGVLAREEGVKKNNGF